MDDDGLRATDGWNARARHETPTQRLDRNWTDLLQELRVVQTGVQILTGFLLTLPFQSRFADLAPSVHVVYLVAVTLSVAAACLLVAPVSLHRWLFRRQARESTVAVTHRLAAVGIAFLGLAITAVVGLTFLVVLGPGWGIGAAVATAAVLVLLWIALPVVTRRRAGGEGEGSDVMAGAVQS